MAGPSPVLAVTLRQVAVSLGAGALNGLIAVSVMISLGAEDKY
jgi:hypothetical protein